jgi:hypothetical protein
MNEQHTLTLCKKFPKIFPLAGERNSNLAVESPTFYFECGDGWYHILHSLCENLQSYIDYKIDSGKVSTEEAVSLQVIATQIKEKFGTLRFYVVGGDEVTDGMISLAESISEHTCEGCGNVGTTYNNGWVRTHCESCEKEYQNRLKGLNN